MATTLWFDWSALNNLIPGGSKQLQGLALLIVYSATLNECYKYVALAVTTDGVMTFINRIYTVFFVVVWYENKLLKQITLTITSYETAPT